jgi:conserved hypothetical protein
MKSLQMYRNLFANIIKIRKSGRFFSNMAGQGWNIAGNLITFAQLKRRMSMNLKALLEPVGTFAWWRSMFAIVLGCLIMAAGYSYFVSPYNIVPGGVYGMGIVLHNVFPSIQVGTFGYMIDVPLLASAIIVFGRQFGGRTLFAACLTPGLINLLSWIAFPNQEALEALDPKHLFGGVIDLSNDLMLASLLGAVLIGLGVGLVLRNQATTGGTDIIAMYLQKFAKMKFSTGILLADSCVVLSGLLVIGFGVGSGADREAVEGGSWLLSFYSLITIYVSSRVLAYVIDGASYDKLLFIISENHHAELRDFIIEDMDRSGTYIKGKGMYTDQDREMIFVVVSRKEVHLVQNKVREIDPKAFMVVTDAYETFGEGFKQFPDKDTIQAVG